jgi:hypothetical protein
MKYTKYFAKMVESYGVPQFQRDAFQRMQNIIIIEAKIKAYQEVKAKFLGLPEEHKFDLRILSLSDFLKELTEDLEPNDLVEELQIGKKKLRSKEVTFTPWDENDPYLDLKKNRH